MTTTAMMMVTLMKILLLLYVLALRYYSGTYVLGESNDNIKLMRMDLV